MVYRLHLAQQGTIVTGTATRAASLGGQALGARLAVQGRVDGTALVFAETAFTETSGDYIGGYWCMIETRLTPSGPGDLRGDWHDAPADPARGCLGVRGQLALHRP
jgi:hypothetical protein